MKERFVREMKRMLQISTFQKDRFQSIRLEKVVRQAVRSTAQREARRKALKLELLEKLRGYEARKRLFEPDEEIDAIVEKSEEKIPRSYEDFLVLYKSKPKKRKR